LRPDRVDGLPTFDTDKQHFAMQVNSLTQRLPRHLKMAELRAFVAVLEHRSFHKAAAVLHLTQPAITKTIANLEATLGVKLFHRALHGVEPTVHGLSFAPRAAAVFDELRRAAHELALVSLGASGALRVGIVPMPAIPFLPVALQRLMAAHPDALFTVVEGRETELIDRLRKGDIEVAILRLSLIDADDDMLASTLFEERLCVVAAKSHRLASRTTLTWPELLAERWVMPTGDCYFHDHVLRTLGALDLEMPRQTVESASVNIQFGLVLHAGMLSFGMRSQVEFAPGKEQLVRLPYELSARDGAVAAVSLKRKEPSPLALQLVAHIRNLAGFDAAPASPEHADTA
jgi:DNA-binding transcriptional LysR family regulator